jgi:hypothetical protein
MSTLSNHRTTSAIRYPRRFWRYLLLFQSWGQLQSWLITIALTMLVITEAMVQCGASQVPLVEIVVGGMLGSLASVAMVVPAEFDVLSNPDHAAKFFRRQIEGMAYVQLSSEPGMTTYRSKLPRCLRWNEGNVTVHQHENKVTVSGGVMMLRLLRRLY